MTHGCAGVRACVDRPPPPCTALCRGKVKKFIVKNFLVLGECGQGRAAHPPRAERATSAAPCHALSHLPLGRVFTCDGLWGGVPG